MKTIYCTYLYIIVLLLSLSPIIAQTNNTFQQQLENLSETSETESNDFLLENLNFLKEHPLNLNKTSKTELLKLGFLNAIQINNILTYIEDNGPLLNIYELQSIPKIDLQSIRNILPYVYVTGTLQETTTSPRTILKDGKHAVILRYSQILEEQKGFKDTDSLSFAKATNSRYIGSPQKLYARYNFTFPNAISAGITGEKDQGEVFLKQNEKFTEKQYNSPEKRIQRSGFDFYSAHLFLENIRIFKSIAIGDYSVSFGQGLTAWNSFALGIGNNITSVKRNARGISPYKSVDENNFMRGAATTIQLNKFELSLFASRHSRDANIIDTLNNEVLAISSLQNTGNHATVSELFDKDAVKQTVYGANISYIKRSFNIGITALRYKLNTAYTPTLSPSSQFRFSSNKNLTIGLDYNYTKRNFNLFGEQAISKNGGMAFVNGVLIYLDKRVSLSLLHRHYQRNYQNLIANGIGTGSNTSNENGLYIGTNIDLSNKVTLSAHMDRYKRPWLSFQKDAPSAGQEWSTQINYNTSRKNNFYIRIRERSNQQNFLNKNEKLNALASTKQQNIRLNINYSPLNFFRFQNRVEFVRYSKTSEEKQTGYLIYQDVIYQPKDRPYSIKIRYALFDTDSYQTRIYAYEHDVDGVFSIPAHYNRGNRIYLLLNYKIKQHISCWIRLSQTYYDDKQTINNGALTEISGQTKSDIKAQIRFSF